MQPLTLGHPMFSHVQKKSPFLNLLIKRQGLFKPSFHRENCRAQPFEFVKGC